MRLSVSSLRNVDVDHSFSVRVDNVGTVVIAAAGAEMKGLKRKSQPKLFGG